MGERKGKTGSLIDLFTLPKMNNEESRRSNLGVPAAKSSSDVRKLSSAVPIGRKIVIKNADMKEDVQKEAVEVAMDAFEKHSVEKDVAEYIKKEFDKKHGPTWHCIVGKNFVIDNEMRRFKLRFNFISPALTYTLEVMVPTSRMRRTTLFTFIWTRKRFYYSSRADNGRSVVALGKIIRWGNLQFATSVALSKDLSNTPRGEDPVDLNRRVLSKPEVSGKDVIQKMDLVPSIDELFFAPKILLANSQMVEADLMDIDSHELPNPRCWPYCK
ncbi:hypothetical protein SAY87_010860 [Trapa incisa]|uniref:Dynein light chain 1, cytoplasmic n=1 Tax=Trapa incisa TaxID=236973 RepID=A0AAN7JIQ3_9MYRT|nr:hypothetical protein SAY87_010860 [Trapa incisa]